MRKGKYNIAPKSQRTLKGVTYMSKLEMRYRKHLDLLTKASGNDKVLSIKEQVPFPIIINGITCFKYLLDFEVQYPNRVEYVDTKGIKGGTDVYRIKKKCVEAQYNIKIKEVYDKDF